ncbi:MAG: tRNA preQ1(34) S-adenosylmethionine ribosyltransferase-isomerase QueA [Acidimicrobiales bacterium]|nr:tRNA preQ1(34) S-adenosylmethionine ribosyltransferase-isomerase QueA [Acidimicrobiales bacterium]
MPVHASNTDDFDYPLPPERIAQHPRAERDLARLLVDEGPGRPPSHRLVRDLPELLEPGDLLVVNDTRVLPARLALRRATGGAVEVLLLERHADGSWEALVRPSRRVRPGEQLVLIDGPADEAEDQTKRAARPRRSRPAIEVGEELGDGRRRLRFVGLAGPVDSAGESAHANTVDAELALIEQVGIMPLPPYIHVPLADAERYQTVYARRPASAAAPTAGLHLTEELLERCRDRGIGVMAVELVVGLGTFRPIVADKVEDHRMHAEHYRVPAETMEACRSARQVVAVGTTTLRALESAAASGQLEGCTELYIRGDYPFAVVDRLLTNFHQPRSSLLVLVDAFIGPRWRELYDAALARDYRFLSFGDAMLLTRHDLWGDGAGSERNGGEPHR